MQEPAGFLATVAVCAALCAPFASTASDVDAFVKGDKFGDIEISPTGEYYAATVPFEDRTALVLLRRADSKLMATFSTGKNTHVADFEWVNAERVLLSTV